MQADLENGGIFLPQQGQAFAGGGGGGRPWVLGRGKTPGRDSSPGRMEPGIGRLHSRQPARR